jgi:two-component system sensor histidine kinase/response regulator
MKRVLVADDKESSREFVRTVLEHSGCVVDEAIDGREALAKVREDPPDLVVLDLHMPGLDGFAVMQELRQDARYLSLPVVALTASAMHGDRERALAAGFVDYMTKPISLSVLRGRVLELIADKEVADEPLS